MRHTARRNLQTTRQQKTKLEVEQKKYLESKVNKTSNEEREDKDRE